VTACMDCGQTHRTGLDGIRCDLNQWGEHETRGLLNVFGLTHQQIDELIDQAGHTGDDT
jgi:hypothetical protein